MHWNMALAAIVSTGFTKTASTDYGYAAMKAV